TGLAWEDVCPLDGKHTPRIAVLPGTELLLLIQENVGLFYNLSTKQPSPKNMVTWPRKVTHLGASANYVFGSSGLGQLDIFGIQDQKNCQTLTLDGVTVSICQAGAGRALVAAETSVTCLSPIPFEKQVKKLLLQVRINDARELITATYGPEDPERQLQLQRFQRLAGWVATYQQDGSQLPRGTKMMGLPSQLTSWTLSAEDLQNDSHQRPVMLQCQQMLAWPMQLPCPSC
ncbi:CPK2, partial [Symbiodinium sp. KB8]